MTLKERIEALKADKARLVAEIRDINAKLAKDAGNPGLKERGANLLAGAAKIDSEIAKLETQWTDGITNALATGQPFEGMYFSTEGVDSRPTARVGNRPVSAWTQTVIAGLDGKTIQERGSHSTFVPVMGGLLKPILNAWPTDDLSENSPDSTPHPMARRARFVHEVFDVRQVATDDISYIRQTTRNNLADAVARHGAKPTSTYELTRISDRCRTIAHLSEPIAVQDLSDNASLDLFVEAELVLGLKLGLDSQILGGAAAGEDMTVNLNETITATETFSNSSIETCRKAITSLEEVDVEPNFWLMAPEDWETIDLAQTADGDFINAAGPVNRMQRLLWGIPVLPTPAVTAGTAILGDRSGARLAVRENARIDWATAGYVDAATDYDLFDRNEVKARAELRAVFEILSIPKFRKVDMAA